MQSKSRVDRDLNLSANFVVRLVIRVSGREIANPTKVGKQLLSDPLRKLLYEFRDLQIDEEAIFHLPG
jgi:hypothetical protein